VEWGFVNQMARVMFLVLCGQLLLAGCSASRDTPVDRQVSVGTHVLHLYCQGKPKGGWAGSSTVIIDTGSGETYESWLPLMGKLAQETRVCAYDRAGYGQSEPGPLPRDAGREADELRLLLLKAGVKGPYVLVGHSLGSLNVQVFASNYPSLVAGAVLIDPPPLGWLAGDAFPELRALYDQQVAALQSQGEALRGSSDPKDKAGADLCAMMASEMTELVRTSAHQAAAITSFGDLPLTVVASTKPNPQFGASAEAFQRFWIIQSEELAGKSARGAFIRAEDSSHHVHLDAPQVVMDAVRTHIQQPPK
jgi:pimeloyl-ACP methyl ester carboxylesterase